MEGLAKQALVLWTAYWPRLVAALLILIVGGIAIRIVIAGLRRALTAARLDPGLVGFLASIARIGAWAVVIISALGKLGVETTTFAAVVGAAGLAIGFALQGSLGNLAAGVLILFFRPFKVGDYVEAAGTAGVVNDIAIFSTVLTTPDNKRIIVPNSSVTGGNITNYSALDTRRIDLVFGIGYGDDILKARDVLQQILDADERVLKEPESTIAVLELADSSVNFAVRPWVKTSDYWPTYFAITEQVKLRFDEAGISIPFPQQDVHMHQVA
ncbi:MAG: mechanosensitive ion channel domain-containing protein [Myxococcota bacterium]